MLSMELINLYSIISAAISLVISFASALSKVIAPKTFIQHKNLMLGTSGLARYIFITTDNAQTI